MKPDLCIHHAPCQDGFTAAWAIWKRWPDVEFFPGVYGAPPPDVTGKHVLIVDFSYKLDVLRRMGAQALSITIIDHHKSAQADLEPFAVERLATPRIVVEAARAMQCLPVQALFDMEKSGARLAWDYAHPGEAPPRIVRHVEDRDLWRFDLKWTREISAALFSHPYTFEVFDAFARELEREEGWADIVSQGLAIERKHHKDVGELLAMTTRWMTIGGHLVPVANLPYTMASDAANQLAEGRAFGACYYDNSDGRRVFSLRSKPGGADVSEIARAYGGGGHMHAGGFSAEKGWEGDKP